MADLSRLLAGSSYRPRTPSTTAPAPPRRTQGQVPSYLTAARAQSTKSPDQLLAIRSRLDEIVRQRSGPAAPAAQQGDPPNFGQSSNAAPSLWGQTKRLVKGIPQAIGSLVTSGAETAIAAPRILGEAAYAGVTGREGPLSRALQSAGSGWTGHDIYNQDMMTPQLEDYMKSVDIDPEAKEGGLLGAGGIADQYIPLTAMMGRSLKGTGGRAYDALGGDFSDYKTASDEGRILEMVLEDIGNVGMVGTVAGKALGTTGRAVSVTPQQARALGVSRGQSAGSAVNVLDDVSSRLSPLSKLGADDMVVGSTGAVSEMKMVVDIQGKGLAGKLERAGYGVAAKNVATAGKVMYRAGRLGEAVDDAQFALPFHVAGKVAKKVGSPAAARFGRFADAYDNTHQGTLSDVLRPFGTEVRRQRRLFAEIESTLGRQTNAQERAYINALVVADEAKLTVPQQRASTFAIDGRFMPLVQTAARILDDGKRTGGVDPIVLDAVIERAYPRADEAMRPSVDDVQTYLDWKAGRLDDVQTTAMNQVAELVANGSERLTAQYLTATNRKGGTLLNPAQLAADMIPEYVDVERGKIERKRDSALKERDRVTKAADHARRVADANSALVELPPPPDPKVLVGEGVAAGRFQGEVEGLRQQYQVRRTEVATAFDRYERAVADRATTVDRLAAELERKVEQANKLRDEVSTLERRADAVASPLAGVTGVDIEYVEMPPELPGQVQPPVDLSDLPPVTQIAVAMDEVRQPQIRVALGHVKQWVDDVNVVKRKSKKTGKPIGGTRLEILGDVPQLPAGWTGTAGRSMARIRKYGMDGFLGSTKGSGALGAVGRGVPLDIWVDRMNARFGKNWGPEQAVDNYFEAIDNYYDAQSRTSESAIKDVADATGLSPDAIQTALEGGAEAFRDMVRKERVEALLGARAAFDNMEPSVRDSILAEFERMRESGATNGELASYMDDVLEGEVPGTQLLDPIWQMPMGDLVEFVRGQEIPEPVIQRVVNQSVEGPGLLQKEQLARLEQKIVDARAQTRSVYTDQRKLRNIVDRTDNLLRQRETQAGRELDSAGAATGQLGEILGEYDAGRQLFVEAGRKAAADSAGVWKRTPGSRLVVDEFGEPVLDAAGKQVRERTDPPSPAERAIARQERLDGEAQRTATVQNRIDRKVEKYNEDIADLPNELQRGVVERLKEDVNQPAIKTLRNTLRSLADGNRLGGAEKVGDAWELTGLLGDIARRYGIHDEMLAAYFHEKKMAGGGRLQPMVVRNMMETVIEDAGVSHIEIIPRSAVAKGAGASHAPVAGPGITDGVPTQRAGLSTMDKVKLGQTWQAEQMLYEIDDVLDTNRDANAPFRVIEHIREMAADKATFDLIPNDLLNRIDAQWDRYLRKRERFLLDTTDAQASVMPGRFRAVSANSRRAIRGLLDEANALIDAGDHGSAQQLLRAAEQVPTTLDAMVKAGIDPTYLTGGQAPSVAPTLGGGRALTGRALRAESMLEQGLRPVDLQGVVQLQMHQAGQFLVNNAADYIEAEMGVSATSVVGEMEAAWKQNHRFDEVPPPSAYRKALADAGYQAATPTATIGAATKVLPISIAKQLQSMRREPGAIWRAVNKGNVLFKTSVLPLSPRWLAGNVVGNAFMAMFNYGMGPLELARLVDEIQKMEGGWKQLRKQGGLAGFAPDDLATHGLHYNEHQLRWGTKAELLAALDGKTPTRWGAAKGRATDFIGASYNLNEFVDNIGRSAVFLKEFRKHGDPTLATKAALKAMGDFTRMTPFERRYMRQVLPFYPWLRHQTAAAMRLPFQSPYRAAFLLHLSDMMNDPDMGPEMLELLNSKLNVAGQYWNIGGLSPFGDPTGLGLDPTNPDVTRSVSPVFKLPYKVLTGKDLGGGAISRPYQDRPTDLFGRETSKSPLRRALEGDPMGGLGEIGYLAAGELPQSRALRDAILGPGEFRYQSGDRGSSKYDKDVSVSDVLLRGAALPNRTDNVDLQQMLRDQARRRAEARRRAMSGR